MAMTTLGSIRGGFSPICPLCKTYHEPSTACPSTTGGSLGQSLEEKYERDRKIQLYERDAALRGWICPVCGGGNGPTASRCPCVPIPIPNPTF